MAIGDPAFELIKALQAVYGLDFQFTIESIISSRHQDFQTIPRTPGDGGLDGLSHGFSVAYCCYGLDLTSTRPNAQQKKKVLSKFKGDLDRLGEIKRSKKAVILENNKTLAGILGENRKIARILLVCNWFEDNTVIGPLVDHLDDVKMLSKKRFLTDDCNLNFCGPKEIVRDYHIPTDVRLSLINPSLAKTIAEFRKDYNPSMIDVPSTTKFDSKFQVLFEKNPDKTEMVQDVKDKHLDDWRRYISFSLRLEEDQPGAAQVLSEVVEYAVTVAKECSIANVPPYEAISSVKTKINQKIQSKFSSFSNELTADLSEFIVASLIGVCPLDWR